MYIHAHNLSLDYPLPGIRKSFLGDVFSRKVGGKIFSNKGQNTYIRALDRINFEINPGDRVGIYGNNGSGKTTLLKVLAGIYPISEGSLSIQGRVTSFLSMNLGMDPDLTGYENIVFRATTPVLFLKAGSSVGITTTCVAFKKPFACLKHVLGNDKSVKSQFCL